MTERSRRDLAQGWLRKAESDFAALGLALRAGTALDTACFHAQQGAENVLKAYLIDQGLPFPFTHNLAKLLLLCQTRDPAFSSLADLANTLTPYAVELRYDSGFWPSAELAGEAQEAALTIKAFVMERLSTSGDNAEATDGSA